MNVFAFKKIMVAYDKSQHANRALATAMGLAKALGARLKIVTVRRREISEEQTFALCCNCVKTRCFQPIEVSFERQADPPSC